MGLFYDYPEKRKRCTMCGCILLPDSESDICECCLDELYASCPGDSEEDFSL